jgi:hypothetical protein
MLVQLIGIAALMAMLGSAWTKTDEEPPAIAQPAVDRLSRPQLLTEHVATFLSRVRDVTGESQEDCGQFRLRNRDGQSAQRDLDGAIACILTNAQSMRPALTWIEHQGRDSFIAAGLVVRASGAVERFHYDSIDGNIRFEPCATPTATATGRKLELGCLARE